MQALTVSRDALLFYCAKTASELHLFEPLNLRLQRKQIPGFAIVGSLQMKFAAWAAYIFACYSLGSTSKSIHCGTTKLTAALG
jgi:hypothetical protein